VESDPVVSLLKYDEGGNLIDGSSMVYSAAIAEAQTWLESQVSLGTGASVLITPDAVECPARWDRKHLPVALMLSGGVVSYECSACGFHGTESAEDDPDNITWEIT
jgi:hypothetical protein